MCFSNVRLVEWTYPSLFRTFTTKGAPQEKEAEAADWLLDQITLEGTKLTLNNTFQNLCPAIKSPGRGWQWPKMQSRLHIAAGCAFVSTPYSVITLPFC